MGDQLEEPGPLNRFHVDVSKDRFSDRERDLRLRRDALSDRLDRLVEKAVVKGSPLLESIISFSHNPDELDRLGRALQRAATILPELDKLNVQLKVFEVAASDPNFIAWALGDFAMPDDIDLDKELGQP